MNEIVINVNNVSKAYKLYDSHADRVKETFHPLRKKYHRDFYALKDVSFEVKKGETLGIIGRNGSGKSTLLQIICGILQPTSGQVEVQGSISALLELGAGFNPEFSGHDNVYINGAIFGLSREEIDARYDDILKFADIGDFINQPVKSYSSGMVVRLAFAIAISVNPDILVVDEALAVGDEAFQRKCYARIKQIQKQGGTILFVSHGAGIVVELCNTAILLDQGELLLSGSPKNVITNYQKMIFSPAEKIEDIKQNWRQNKISSDRDSENPAVKNDGATVSSNKVKSNNGRKESAGQKAYYAADMKPQSSIFYERRGAIIQNPQIKTLAGEPVNMLVNREKYIYTYTVYFEQPAFQVRFGMLIKTISGLEIGGAATAALGDGIAFVEQGRALRVEFKFNCFLNPGVYFMNAGVLGVIEKDEVFLDRNIDVTMFRVQEIENYHSTAIVDLVEHDETLVYEKKSVP